MGYLGTLIGGIGGAIIGGPAGAAAGASIGNMFDSARAQDKSFKKAKNYTLLQKEIAQKQLEFDKQKYNDWENIFGPIAENVSHFVRTIEPYKYESQIADNITSKLPSELRTINKTMGARGLLNSGLTDYYKNSAITDLYPSLAKANLMADDYVKNIQNSFVNMMRGNSINQFAAINNALNDYRNSLNSSISNRLNDVAGYGKSLVADAQALGTLLGRNSSNNSSLYDPNLNQNLSSTFSGYSSQNIPGLSPNFKGFL